MKKKKFKFDEYRVTLFKKKLRALLGHMEGVRFGRSIGRCHLILDIGYRYFSKRDEVARYVSNTLAANDIQFTPKQMRWNESEIPSPVWPIHYFSIPIDQAALPERKRV